MPLLLPALYFILIVGPGIFFGIWDHFDHFS